ncbi:MAG: hypothetical protein BZ138_08135 [Methanosphaera sp. rholeuAM270]|nr:MAG: hypothetical protein BZ138_08135 [Methanosphaera sp. rholeuAM270]
MITEKNEKSWKEIIMNTSYLFHERFGRALHINIKNKNYIIHKIYFYNDDGILFSMHYFRDDREFRYYGKTNRRLKLTFDNKDNFIIKSDESYWREPYYDLYIYTGNNPVTYHGKLVYNGWLSKQWEIHDEYHENYIYLELLRCKRNKIDRLEAKVEHIINRELLSCHDFHAKDSEELEKIFNKIRKYNDRIQSYKLKLKLREIHDLPKLSEKYREA